MAGQVPVTINPGASVNLPSPVFNADTRATSPVLGICSARPRMRWNRRDVNGA
jgi:hypothetical protein